MIHRIGGALDSHRSIHSSVQTGERCVVWAFARVLANVILGDDVSIGGGAEIGASSIVGNRTRISAGVFLPSHSHVGADVFIGPNATFTDDRYPQTLKPGETYTAEPPIIADGVSIGAGAIILPGVRIGAKARIASGAIVTRDVAPGALIVGSAAREREPSESAKAHWAPQPA